jgi:hypothetical protein
MYYRQALPFEELTGHWIQIKDGDLYAMELFKRHYSYYHYRDGRIHNRFCGPGEKIVLITKDGRALFVWRKFKPMDNQSGVNCAIFRNESDTLSSELILEAERYAWERWPGERLYTYVDAYKIKSTNPGYCFKCSGWQVCGITKKRKLIILDKRGDFFEKALAYP